MCFYIISHIIIHLRVLEDREPLPSPITPFLTDFDAAFLQIFCSFSVRVLCLLKDGEICQKWGNLARHRLSIFQCSKGSPPPLIVKNHYPRESIGQGLRELIVQVWVGVWNREGAKGFSWYWPCPCAQKITDFGTLMFDYTTETIFQTGEFTTDIWM